jgi:hypothetical protein
MAKWHLEQLQLALERKGWRIVAEYPGDEDHIAATWEIERSNNEKPILIDFVCLGATNTMQVEQSDYCSVRRSESLSLHFQKQGYRGSERRQAWQSDLCQFIREL